MTDFLGRLKTPRLAGAPSSPTVGELYYNTSTNTLYWWNGTTWIAASGGGSGGTEYWGAYSAVKTYNDGDCAIGSDGVLYMCTVNGTVGVAPVAWPGATGPEGPVGATGAAGAAGATGAAGTPGSVVRICDLILGASQATIDTNTILGGNIPSTYRHLQAIMSLRCDQAATSVGANLRVNNDSGANYSDQWVQISGSSVTPIESSSVTQWNVGSMGSTGLASSFWEMDMLIPNYARTDRTKSALISHGIAYGMASGQHIPRWGMGVWNSTAAIIRIALSLATGNFIAGSTFSLYGIT